jgi:hypothetical protein
MCTLLLAVFFAFSPIAASNAVALDDTCGTVCDLGALNERIESNRERIFGRVSDRLEQTWKADLEAAMERNENELTGAGQ